MKIEYLGHSCFKLTSESGVSVLCDPYEPSVGFSMPKISADLVTVSHNHYDHCNVKAVGGDPQTANRAGDFNFRGIEITAVKSFHDAFGGRLRGENLIFKFLIDGIVVCHLGDVGEPVTEELEKKLSPVDVLMIPVGGVYTIDAAQAKTYVDVLRPKIVIPMHYGCAALKIDVASAERFIALFDAKDVERLSVNETQIRAQDLRGGTKVKVMRGR